MVPYKRPAGEKSGIPVYQPGATTYQQLMQLQQPFVPVSCEYRNSTITLNNSTNTMNNYNHNDNDNNNNNTTTITTTTNTYNYNASTKHTTTTTTTNTNTNNTANIYPAFYAKAPATSQFPIDSYAHMLSASIPSPANYPLAYYNNYYCQQPTTNSDVVANINHYANYNDTMTRTLSQQTPPPVFNCSIPPLPLPSLYHTSTINSMSGNQNSQLSTIQSTYTTAAAASATAGTATADAAASNAAVANQQHKSEINSSYKPITSNCSVAAITTTATTITKTIANVLNNQNDHDNNYVTSSSSSSSSSNNNLFSMANITKQIANNHNHNNNNNNIYNLYYDQQSKQQQDINLQIDEEQEQLNNSRNSCTSTTTSHQFSISNSKNNSENNSNSLLINSMNNFDSNSNLICKGNSNCNNVVTSSSYLAYANNNNNTTHNSSLMNNNSSLTNGGNNLTQIGNNNNNNNGHLMTSGNNNNNNNTNNENIISSSFNNNYTNLSNNNKINDSSCPTNKTTTTPTTIALNTITTNTSTLTNNFLTDTSNSPQNAMTTTNTDSSSPKLINDTYALMNNNNNSKSIIDKNLGNTVVADGGDTNDDKETPSPITASTVANFNGTSDSSNNNHSHYKNLSNHSNDIENKTQDEHKRNPFMFKANGENFDEKSSSVSNDTVVPTLNGTDKKIDLPQSPFHEESATVNGLTSMKATTNSGGILATPSSAPATMINTSNVYTNPYQQNLRYYNPFVSAAAAVPGVSYPQAVVSSSFSVSQPQFSFAANPTYTYGTYASAPPTPTGVSSAASYYATDPAALAKEVAQKNYAHAVKMAASANPLAGKPLTAAAYTGMSLNKSFTHAPSTSNMAAQHAAFFQAQHAQAAAAMAAAQMRSMAASSLPGSSLSTPIATPMHTPTHQANNLLQRSATTGYLSAAPATPLNMLRPPPTMTMSAPSQGAAYAAIAQQPQAFFYPGMMAAPTAYPFTTALNGMPTGMTPTAAPATPVN